MMRRKQDASPLLALATESRRDPRPPYGPFETRGNFNAQGGLSVSPTLPSTCRPANQPPRPQSSSMFSKAARQVRHPLKVLFQEKVSSVSSLQHRRSLLTPSTSPSSAPVSSCDIGTGSRCHRQAGRPHLPVRSQVSKCPFRLPLALRQTIWSLLPSVLFAHRPLTPRPSRHRHRRTSSRTGSKTSESSSSYPSSMTSSPSTGSISRPRARCFSRRPRSRHATSRGSSRTGRSTRVSS